VVGSGAAPVRGHYAEGLRRRTIGTAESALLRHWATDPPCGGDHGSAHAGLTVDVVVCGLCGTGLRDTAKFCDACAAPVAGAAETARYKQVTVLFADVVRSMEIAAGVDAERWREIMTELVERCAAVVRHYGGTAEFNGDGVMALFGAPVALEDHAFRGCLAALSIQESAKRLAAEVQIRDGVALRLRVGLNSGRVIAGEIGSGSLGYAATGEHVGFAERMQSVAPTGGVMLSESTAQLVDHLVELGDPEWVHIKGSTEPVRARRLLAISPRDGAVGRAEASLVGRRWEMASLDAVLDRAVSGGGSVVNVVGPPGIGKSRLAREIAAGATRRGVKVFWAFCESHTHGVSFGAIARLLREGTGVAGLDDAAARSLVREQVTDVDPQDLLLLDDFLGIADSAVPLPQIDPDARRRRLTALIIATSLKRTQPALLIVEDVHWIDAASESMLADFMEVVPRTRSMVLLTARPEYKRVLPTVAGAQTIAPGPLGLSDTNAMLRELLGSDPSIGDLAAVIAERAAGNPFFAEEMMRELVQRGVLVGDRGSYVCRADVAEVRVPATVQAAIEARIDGLSLRANRTLSAASVIGNRFGADLLAAMGVDSVLDELLSAELIDQVRFTPSPEYAFRHPLIRAVAYESQLKTDRAQWHRRLAAAIQDSAPNSVDENAALIAEHLGTAGELPAAYRWHMRAGVWSADRDIDAARTSWESARRIADQLPVEHPDTLSMRIAPRTMLCTTDWQGPAVQESRARFEDLRELCSAAGDTVSLVIAMTGLALELLYAGRTREGARLASEQMALLHSIGDPTLTMALAFAAFLNWINVGEVDEILRWSQTIIDLAEGDPAKGAGYGVGSPLAAALAWRGVARWWLGRPGSRQDLHDAVAMARDTNPQFFALVVWWTYGVEIQYGVLQADDAAMRAIEEAVRAARSAGNDFALSSAQHMLGVALLYRDSAADRDRGLELVVQSLDTWRRDQFLYMVPVTELLAAREHARRGDRDASIAVMREAVDELYEAGRLGFGVWGTGILAEALLERGAEDDLAEVREAIDGLKNLRADQGYAVRAITLLRLRALLARAKDDHRGQRYWANRYRDTAEALGFEAHVAWAQSMIAEDETRA
jgi:class 3 adenylate cyclase